MGEDVELGELVLVLPPAVGVLATVLDMADDEQRGRAGRRRRRQR